MGNLLEDGQRFNVDSVEGTVVRLLGGGGQGEVYKAELGGREVALKWYYQPSASSEQRRMIEDLVDRPPPDDRFLWPSGLAEADGVPGFGYVMRLRPPEFKGIEDLLLQREPLPTFRALATASFQLADSYWQLHVKGLCYRDLSEGNAFFDPVSGNVLICDNDNVAVNGATHAGVNGTQRFMAPEIVRGEAKPSADTDRYSLGVLLFYMLFVHHPLEGAKECNIRVMDPPAMQKLYGREPVYIFDPKDDSNRPVPGVHDNATAYWNVYPNALKRLFEHHFTEGLHNPAKRVRETQWREAFASLADSIVYCACGVENFYDRDTVQRGEEPTCWRCAKPLQMPPRMRIEGRGVVMLNHDTKLFPHHVGGSSGTYDFSAPLAEVRQHPKKAGVWGLANLSTQKWVLTNAAGEMRDVHPGNSALLAHGATINFGRAEGKVRA